MGVLDSKQKLYVQVNLSDVIVVHQFLSGTLKDVSPVFKDISTVAHG